MKPEQLEEIRKRSDKASGNWLADYLKMKNAQVVLGDDVPALLAEVERLRKALDWYANLSNYTANETSCDGLPAIDNDFGGLARITLDGGDA